MILRLVERRKHPAPLGAAWAAEGFQSGLPARLAAALGRADWGCDVVLVDDDIMAGLNLEFRNVPGVTDVLSFSYLQGAGEGEAVLRRGQGRAAADLWLDSLAAATGDGPTQVVGEVVLAPGFIVARCREKNWSEDQEIPLLVVHGILHVLGWDHQDERETTAMRNVEAEILAAEGLPHPLLGRS
ncbi:MAG: rRNA maturation RNase YbeY [Candidatus Krumholzibacteriota bacterium]